MRVALVWAAVLLLLSGCRTTAVDRLLGPEDPRPARLIAQLEASAQRRQALRGEARLALDAPDLRLRQSQRIALERPARLRVEMLSLFGQIAGVLVTVGGRYQFLDLSRRDLQEGRLTPALLWELARIDLRVEEAVDLLLASPRPAPAHRLLRATQGRDGQLTLDFADPGENLAERYVFDEGGDLIRVERFAGPGEAEWAATFAEHREVAGERFPHRVELEFARVEARARFDFSRAELPSALDEELFHIEWPP